MNHSKEVKKGSPIKNPDFEKWTGSNGTPKAWTMPKTQIVVSGWIKIDGSWVFCFVPHKIVGSSLWVEVHGEDCELFLGTKRSKPCKITKIN